MKMKKLDPIKHEDFREAQKYLEDKSIENGRTAFKIRSQILESVPGSSAYFSYFPWRSSFIFFLNFQNCVELY